MNNLDHITYLVAEQINVQNDQIGVTDEQILDHVQGICENADFQLIFVFQRIFDLAEILNI